MLKRLPIGKRIGTLASEDDGNFSKLNFDNEDYHIALLKESCSNPSTTALSPQPPFKS